MTVIMMMFYVFLLSCYVSVQGTYSPKAECAQHFIFEGVWDHNNGQGLRNLTVNEHNSLRYHSVMKDTCQFSDFLKASTANEAVRGHLNEEIEHTLLFRLKALRGKTWLNIGTSIDHRITRTVCPYFKTSEKVTLAEEGDLNIYLAHCYLPMLDFHIAYVFSGSLAFNFTESSARSFYSLLQGTLSTTLTSSNSTLPPPAMITLSGIEWDLKMNPNVTAAELRNCTLRRIEILSELFPGMIFSLRTQYYSGGRRGNSPTQPYRFVELSEVFYELARERYPIALSLLSPLSPKILLLVSDIRVMMREGGLWSTGWTDGLHPGVWVVLQYTNLVMHQMNDAILLYGRK